MKALVVDDMSYHDYLKHHEEGCCMFSLAHDGCIQERSNITLNTQAVKLFGMPLKIAYKVKHILERKGQIGRIKILKC